MKKVWPIALAATAIFFTAGAAIAPAGSWLSGMGWGKVASTLVGKVGIKGTLGKVLTGSIAGSGWGAAIGGGISAATRGSFTEGARSGALSGAITGGLAGAAGWTPGGKPGSTSGPDCNISHNILITRRNNHFRSAMTNVLDNGVNMQTFVSNSG